MRIDTPSEDAILGCPPVCPEAYKAKNNFFGLEKSQYLYRIFGDTVEYQEDIFFMGKDAASFYILEALRHIVSNGNNDSEEVLEFCLRTILSRVDIIKNFHGSKEIIFLLNHITENLDQYLWVNRMESKKSEILKMIGEVFLSVKS